MKAYYFDDQPGDCRLPHNSGDAVSEEQLARLGVIYRRFPTQEAGSEAGGRVRAGADVDEFARGRNYLHRDEITVSPDAMGAVYEDKIRTFFHEHMHEDEEIRYILRGRGYFDVRNGGDRWVRILCEPGDLLVLPSGIYHRFTTDDNNYINAMRLFQSEPKWTPLNRGDDTDANSYRKAYLESRDGQ